MYTMQPEELYVDTSAVQQDYLPYAVESPMSLEYTEPPQPSAPSWQPMYAPPPPPSNTRSYTLEGAITPITPPQHVAFPTPPPVNVQRVASPPPMGSLLPPASNSLVKIEPESSPIPPEAGPSNPPTVVPILPVVQKRPRGRPRKNPPHAQPPSPPPTVDYPYPPLPRAKLFVFGSSPRRRAHAPDVFPSPHGVRWHPWLGRADVRVQR